MPRLRRRGKVRNPDFEVLSTDQRYELETGRNFFGGFKGNFEDFAEAWGGHREVILAEFIAKRPGHRPFAFYVINHHGAEPILPPALAGDARRRNWMRYRFQHVEISGWDDEPEYLARHGLLTAAEKRALAERST